MTPIRLIAVDLDGTLLDSQSVVSPKNQEALMEAARRGVQIVVVTGRRFHSARPFVDQIPCPVTVISSNGARIATWEGEVLHRDFLPSATARRVLEVAHEYRPYTVAIFDIPGRGQVVMHHDAVPEGPLGWYLKSAPECLAQVHDLHVAVDSNPIQIMFGGPPARIEPLEPVLRSSPVAESFDLTWTKYPARDTSLLDVMNKGCSKGCALALWAKRCGLEASQVMAMGDNFNDIEMLDFAGCPVVMANHTPGFVKPGWTVTRSNDEDGVALAIRQFVLNHGGS
jgi:Cof subfamily protein (haloacid dehalogenase superfamily)